jgi:hypothetical protein
MSSLLCIRINYTPCRGRVLAYLLFGSSSHFLATSLTNTEPEDLRRRAGWDGASGTSRHKLLDALHGIFLATVCWMTYVHTIDYLPPSAKIPERPFSDLHHQVQEPQRQRCAHNPPDAEL